MTMRVLLKQRGDIRLTHVTFVGLNDSPVGEAYELSGPDPASYRTRKAALRAFAVAARHRLRHSYAS